ncbi:hypothetical protein VU14_08295 [Aeromonas hydrophila]|nr:hypothetical protein VU14_08295 [Aeromonas hydrophila]
MDIARKAERARGQTFGCRQVNKPGDGRLAPGEREMCRREQGGRVVSEVASKGGAKPKVEGSKRGEGQGRCGKTGGLMATEDDCEQHARGPAAPSKIS